MLHDDEHEPGAEEDEDKDLPDLEDLDEDPDGAPLVDCPYCGLEIFEQAEQCPYCRRYVTLEATKKKESDSRGWWIWLAVVVALLTVGFWVLRG